MTSIGPEWFWQEAANGRFAFLLDGFDEISIETNEQIRNSMITRVSPLLSTNSKAIISCRPSYFVSADEFNKIIEQQHSLLTGPKKELARSISIAAMSQEEIAHRLRSKIIGRYYEQERERPVTAHRYMRVQISTFSEDQIREYLGFFKDKFRETVNAGPEDILSFLKGVYDLSDLMRRPILFEMIVEMILTGVLDVHNRRLRVGPSTMYDIYTDGKLTMEAGKGITRQLLSKAERKEFTQVVAFAMFKANKLDISFKEVLDIVHEYGNLSDNLRSNLRNYHEIEKVANDITLCGFLVREGDVFRFSHRSFMEFFVARKIFLELRNEHASEVLFEGVIPREVLYFLGGLIMYDDRVFNSLLNNVRAIMARNDEIQSTYIEGAILAHIYSQRRVARLSGGELTIKDLGVKAVDLHELNVSVIAHGAGRGCGAA